MDIVVDAIYDYRYLLSRGYPQEHALNIVSIRYSLDKKQRLFLYRCIHSKQNALEIQSKIVKNVAGGVLVIDFYNTILTMLEAYLGGEVYICDDCLVRDLRGSKLHSGEEEHLPAILRYLTDIVDCLKPRAVYIVADRNVSHSAVHVDAAVEIMLSRGIEAHGILSKTPDRDIIDMSKSSDAVVVSTDIVILTNVRKVYPFTNSFIYRIRDRNPRIFNTSTLLGEDCSFSTSIDCVDTVDK